MKDNRNSLASAIRYALGASVVAGLAATAAPVVAQDQEEEDVADLGRQEVTGSRISRADIEGATPVTIITREDIEFSGQENVADLLRNTVFNSFGSFRERSGTSFGQIALVDLRGLGADRTAVLVNGLRQPGSPFTGGPSANLNSIPINAIERIEILTDSASAVYGADAIGGAINIILRSDYEGAELSTFITDPTREGGDEFAGNVVMGGSGERGNYVFTAEWFERDPIFDADRPYSAAQFGPGSIQDVDTVGTSRYGNTAYFLTGPNAGNYQAVGDCDPSIFAGVFEYPVGDNSTSCSFPYADISAQTGGIKRFGTFLSAEYELNDDHNLYFRNTFSRVDSFGRYAPVAGLFFIDGDNPANDTGEDIYLLHRFVAHGPRDDDFQSYEIDNVLGLEGRIGNVDYDVYGRYFISESDAVGRNYVFRSNIEQLVADGDYNFINPTDPTNADAVTASKAQIGRDLTNKTWQTGVTFSGDAFDMPAGVVGWAAGLEYEDVRYTDIYDPGREAENVLGSAGNTSQGERDRWAVFGEVLVPLLDTLELSVAARLDDYSDFGDAFSPTVALRYQPFDELLLRASWGQGFRAPALTELNSSRAESNNDATDFLFCEQNDIPASECPTRQVTNFSGGNPNLEAEESESFNFGILWEPIENFSIGGDIYSIEIEDAIQQIGIADLLRLEREGSPLPPGTAIVRRANGNIDFIERGFANVAEIKVEGWDLRSNYTLNTDNIGSFGVNAQYSRIKTYDFTSLPGADTNNLARRNGSPSHRANWTLRWNIADFAFSYTGRWIGEQFNANGPLDEDDIADGRVYEGDKPSYVQHDLLAVWYAPWNGELQLGVRNITNRLLPLDPVAGYDDAVDLPLYPVDGRVPFVRYTQRF